MLPTFLGIGVPRSGTTWLHEVLDSHPDVLMAQRRKEVQFFNQHHQRGLDWYSEFFPTPARPPLAVGDFTPGYLFDPAVPERVAAVPSIDRFIVSFRDPIDRLVSHFHSRASQDNFRGGLDDFIEAYPHILDQGRYATHLDRWLDRFGREQVLVLVFEAAIADVPGTKQRLATFLDVEPDRFPAEVGGVAKNAGFQPRRPRLHAVGRRAARFLRRHDIDWGHRVGARLRGDAVRAPAPAATTPTVSPELRRRLVELYRPEAERLAALTGARVEGWPVLAEGDAPQD